MNRFSEIKENCMILFAIEIVAVAAAAAHEVRPMHNIQSEREWTRTRRERRNYEDTVRRHEIQF